MQKYLPPNARYLTSVRFCCRCHKALGDVDNSHCYAVLGRYAAGDGASILLVGSDNEMDVCIVHVAVIRSQCHLLSLAHHHSGCQALQDAYGTSGRGVPKQIYSVLRYFEAVMGSVLSRASGNEVSGVRR